MIPPKTYMTGYTLDQKGYNCSYKGITLAIPQNKNAVEAWLSDSKACGKRGQNVLSKIKVTPTPEIDPATLKTCISIKYWPCSI